ncbi:MAG: gamma-glutamyltransferase [Planctomycetota bacterium]|nr:gamma-glutamyltransferase [Planctomycetota bacterium]
MRILLALTFIIACGHVSPVSAAGEITWRGSGRGGAVASGREEAVAAGLSLLEQDGNAADAAAATLLALAVTDYGLFAMGGEVPLLIYDVRKREVKVLSGLGRAPLDPEAIRWYYDHGIPSGGNMKSAPTPGAVDLCVTLLKLYGTASFEQAVTPTLALLDAGGDDWYPRLAITLRKLVEAERTCPGSREDKLAAARDRFYTGDVADELVAWYRETGSFLRQRDLAAQVTRVEDPVSVNYRGYTVHKCGPWTQGPYLCQSLRLLEGHDLQAMGHLSADYIHVVTESLKLAFADRDEYYGDPLFTDVPLRRLLSSRYTNRRRSLIDMQSASLQRRPGDPGRMQPLLARESLEESRANIPVQDTTTCVVADRFGNLVAATPSCNLLSNKPGPSGVNQGNRLRSLNTTPGHPNRIEPGKRPRITLTPTLVTRNGKPVVAISVAGGDLQDQTTLNLILNHVEFGMLPEEACTVSRFQTGHHQGSFDPNPDRDAAFGQAGSLQVHSGVTAKVQQELTNRGHKLRTTSGAIGYPVMIYIDQQTGIIHAAGDPTVINNGRDRGRHAAALE